MLASRNHWRLLIATIVALIAAAWLAPHWIKPPDIQENRVLAPAPVWPKKLGDFETYRKTADAYVADHFPIRPELIALLNRLRMLVHASGSNRVIVGKNGWLFYDDDTHLGAARGDPPMSSPEVRQWLTTLAGRTESLKARGIPYLVVAAPVKETIYPQFGPRWYHGPNPDRPAERLPRLAHSAEAGDILYLYPAVAEATHSGQTTYSRHDTHWNGYGGYAGYAAIMNRLHAMGLTDGPKPLSAFNMLEAAPGVAPRDLALMLGVASFVPVRFPHVDAPDYGRNISIQYLTAKTDWTGPQVIDTGYPGKPTLLMTRDSFSNEIQPLLYAHFSRLILAHNQDGFWRQDLIDRFKPDIVIMEVIEPGLRVGMGEGPTPSDAAVARVDKVLTADILVTARTQKMDIPTLVQPDATTTAVIVGAKVTGNCNVEVATLAPGEAGDATFTGSGWFSELGPDVTSPKGLIALRSSGGTVVAPILMDKARPDVAAYFKNPAAAQSGFVATFFIRNLPAGVYTPTVYRRAGGGWIGCAGHNTVTAP